MLKNFFNNWKYGIISAFIFFALVVIGMFLFKPALENQKIMLVEEPLTKIKNLSLNYGEEYIYHYKLSNGSFNITYQIKGSKECTMIDIVSGTEPLFCINSQGNDANMSNISFNAPFYQIFRPWMLAVTDGWKWNAYIKTEIFNTKLVLGEIKLSVVGKEEFKGRTAYKVIAYETNTPVVYFWIDDEKRILLREYGSGYEITLMKAPFSLEQ